MRGDTHFLPQIGFKTPRRLPYRHDEMVVEMGWADGFHERFVTRVRVYWKKVVGSLSIMAVGSKK